MSYSGYCKHGVYVGGCGVDWMCGACEAGEPDMTLREAIARVDRKARALWDLSDALVAAALLSDKVPTLAAARELVDDILSDDSTYARPVAEAVRVRDSIARVALSLDDDNYLAREHARLERQAWEQDRAR